MYNLESTLNFINQLCTNLADDKSKYSKLLLIAGPCQLESLEHSLMIANEVKKITQELEIPYIFKASFDKANRTSISGKRGLGLNDSIEIFAKVRTELDIPVITDVHDSSQIQSLTDVVDVFQIPAFLCRQTDLLVAAGKSGKPVMIKKGQFMHPLDMRFAADKVRAGGGQQILLCERGSCFGYRDLVVDMRGLQDMRSISCPVIFDGTHAVQSMGGGDGSSSGAREYIPALCRAAVAVGVNGIFLEVHDNPAAAPSDAASMLPLNELKELLETLNKIHHLQ